MVVGTGVEFVVSDEGERATSPGPRRAPTMGDLVLAAAVVLVTVVVASFVMGALVATTAWGVREALAGNWLVLGWTGFAASATATLLYAIARMIVD